MKKKSRGEEKWWLQGALDALVNHSASVFDPDAPATILIRDVVMLIGGPNAAIEMSARLIARWNVWGSSLLAKRIPQLVRLFFGQEPSSLSGSEVAKLAITAYVHGIFSSQPSNLAVLVVRLG